MFDNRTQGWGDGKDKHLQLLQQHPSEMVFVLSTNTNHSVSSGRGRQMNKQGNVDCGLVFVWGPYVPAAHAKQDKQHSARQFFFFFFLMRSVQLDREINI